MPLNINLKKFSYTGAFKAFQSARCQAYIYLILYNLSYFHFLVPFSLQRNIYEESQVLGQNGRQEKEFQFTFSTICLDDTVSSNWLLNRLLKVMPSRVFHWVSGQTFIWQFYFFVFKVTWVRGKRRPWHLVQIHVKGLSSGEPAGRWIVVIWGVLKS